MAVRGGGLEIRHAMAGSVGVGVSGAPGHLDPGERAGRPVYRPGLPGDAAKAVRLADGTGTGRGPRAEARDPGAPVEGAPRDRPDAGAQPLRHPVWELRYLRRRLPE